MIHPTIYDLNLLYLFPSYIQTKYKVTRHPTLHMLIIVPQWLKFNNMIKIMIKVLKHGL
jgi:hypothetical protein